MTTDSAHNDYEAPELTEVGSIRNLTRGQILSQGQDGQYFFGIPLTGPSGPTHSHGS
jgi:hypothetical protein